MNLLSILCCVESEVSPCRFSGHMSRSWWIYFSIGCLVRLHVFSRAGGIGTYGVLVKEAPCCSGSASDVSTEGSSW